MLRALERAHQLQPDTSPLSWMFFDCPLHGQRVRGAQRTQALQHGMDDDFLENVADPVDKGPETQAYASQIISAD